MRGTYFYSDSCTGTMWWANASGAIWDAGGQNDTTLGNGGVYGFGEDEAGNVYVARGNGQVLRLTSDSIFADGFQ